MVPLHPAEGNPDEGSTSSPTTRHPDMAPVVGGTVSGAFGLVLLFGILFYCVRRRRRKPQVGPSAEFMAYTVARRNSTPTADLALTQDSSVKPESSPVTRTSTGSESYPSPALEKLLEAVAQMRVLQPKGSDGIRYGPEEERVKEDLVGA